MFEISDEPNWDNAEPLTKPDLTLKRRKLEERLEKRKIALVIGKGLRLASTFFGEKSIFDKIDFKLNRHGVELCFQSKTVSFNGEVVERRIQELNKALRSCVTVDTGKNKFFK